MTANHWSEYCEKVLTVPQLGFSLDYGHVRMTAADWNRLQPLFGPALTALSSIDGGSLANMDEGRMVGHYWLRAPELAPTPEIEEEIRATLGDIQRFAAAVHSGQIAGERGPIRHLLHCGIGGSALGPQLVADCLGSAADRLQIHFVDNTDPDGIDRLLGRLAGQLGQTLVTVVSKSGGTPETRNGMLEIEAAYGATGLSFARHAVAVTQAGSLLDQTAVKGGWLARFPMWDWVGGRTSVMSAVGLVPAALQGLDIDSLLAGAREMDQCNRVAEPRQNPSLLLAALWYQLGEGRGAKDMVILPYKDRLALFSRYLQQLIMESLGKALDRRGQHVAQGIAVYGNKGSTDQHAYVQQLREGVHNFFATFIQVLDDRDGPSLEVEPGRTSGDFLHGFYLGTAQALAANGRESFTLTIRTLNARSLGALIALYERAVGLYAEFVNINAYHQPGVEAGKKAAASVLALQTQLVQTLPTLASPATAWELADHLKLTEQADTIYKILEHLSANTGRGVKLVSGYGPRDSRFAAG